MRAVVYVLLVLLALLGVLSGSAALALLFGGAKALLVASEFMELRFAHRAHFVGFGLFVGALTLLLILLSAPR